jgi:hypothetical protein
MRHSSTIVKKNRETNDGNELGWDAMIRDARKRIEDLNYSIKVFEKRKAAGDLCPAIKSEGQEISQQHSV